MPPASPAFLLVIDDADDLTEFARLHLGDAYALRHARDARAAARILDEESDCAGVLLDRDFAAADPAALLGPPDDVRNEGLRILHWLRREHADLPVIMVTSYRELSLAVEVGRLGADFLAWEDISAAPASLGAMVEKAVASTREPDAEILERYRSLGLVAASPAFARVLVRLHHAMKDCYPILLQGETGTGKDTLAWAVHVLSSDREDRPFVSVNLAALSPTLIEAELFGHVRGAFTGAVESRPGKLRAAHGGTLFLNEIPELSLDLQAKLLTAIERREVVPIGSVEAEAVDFRLITASSDDLRRQVERGRFRPDLFYRLDYHRIDLPPLRERKEDVPGLAQIFLREACARGPREILGFTREAMEYLREQRWAGNVRELCAVVIDAASRARHSITVRDVLEAVSRRERRTESGAAGAVGAGAISGAGTGGAGTIAAGPGADPAGRADTRGHDGTAERTAPDQATGDLVFAQGSYLLLTQRYFEYLRRRTGGNIPEMARLAGVAKSTMYDWKRRFEPEED